jgi:hypothetical protein
LGVLDRTRNMVQSPLSEEATSNPNLIVPAGTQAVTLVEVRGRAGGRLCPRGAVGKVIAAPERVRTRRASAAAHAHAV